MQQAKWRGICVMHLKCKKLAAELRTSNNNNRKQPAGWEVKEKRPTTEILYYRDSDQTNMEQ